MTDFASISPFPERAAEALCRCGATEQSRTSPGRCCRGHVLAGNRLAVTHGAYANTQNLPPDRSADVEAADRFVQQATSDQGGTTDLTAIRGRYISKLGALELFCSLLVRDLQTRGLFTRRGRVRNTYLLFLQTIDRWDRLARTIGLERRQREADVIDPAEWLARADAAPAETSGDDAS